MFINPVVTLAGLSSLAVEAHEIQSRHSPGALSVIGLAVQAGVFALVGISWCFRLRVGGDNWDYPIVQALISWYQVVGWAAVNNFVFAIVQVALLGIALRRGRASPNHEETAPLLR